MSTIDREQMKALAELEKRLAEKGVKLGEWTETEEHKAENPLLKDQAKMWEIAKELLEEQVRKDREKLVEMQEMLDRIKHGGGR